ncbi:MAG: hypothetical protein K2Y18_02660 [Alphaproteobacteria bacterium]|nr:hypothetical protein [Alphaproteobacteria bacterium]
MKLQSLLFAFAANTLMPYPLMASDSRVPDLPIEMDVPKCAGVASQGEVLNLEEKKTLLLSACGVEKDRQALINAFNEPSSEDALRQVLAWMTEDRLKRSTKTSNWSSFMLGVLKILEEFEDDKRHAFVLRLEQNGVMTRCSNIFDIHHYLQIFRNSTTEKMNQAMRWVKETGIWEVCKSGEFHLPNLVELVKDYDQEQLGCVTSFLKTTGILSQYCHQNNLYEPRRRLAEMLNLLKTCRTEQLEFLAQWMKATTYIYKHLDEGNGRLGETQLLVLL